MAVVTPWQRLFARTSGLGHPLPLALFRILIYGTCLLHFAPVVLAPNDNFGRSAFRVSNWDPAIFDLGANLPRVIVLVLGGMSMVGAFLGVVGVAPRVAAILTGAGCYSLASLNGLNVQTLALGPLWGILTIWSIAGGGAGALSLRRGRRSVDGVEEDRLSRGLIGYFLLLTVFLAGIEKLWSAWPYASQMDRLLMYPSATLLRGWAVAGPTESRQVWGAALDWLTLSVELLIPLWIFAFSVRWLSVLIWIGFFLGIVAVLEVPPLFLGEYLVVPLLLIDDEKLGVVIAGRRCASTRS
jgi:hypothetical protein